VLGWYAGLALKSVVNADGSVTLTILGEDGEPVTTPTTVDLNTFLQTQVAISELPGAQAFLDDTTIVFTDAEGNVYTRVDLLVLAGSEEGIVAAAVLGWYAGLALKSVVNADGSVTLTILGEDGEPVTTPTTVDLNTFLQTQVAISELPGAQVFLDDNTIVFKDRDGNEYTRVDLLVLAGSEEGIVAAAVLGWYAGLALKSVVNADGSVTLTILGEDGEPMTTPVTVDLNTFLMTQVAISELPGAQAFLDDSTIVFKDRDGNEYTRVDLLVLSGTDEGMKAAAILGWYAGLALKSTVNADGSVTLTILGEDGEPATTPTTVDLNTFLMTQIAISELPEAQSFLDDGQIVFTDADGNEYSRVDLITLAGTEEGVLAAAILGWYAGLALRVEATATGLVIHFYTDTNGNGVLDEGEEFVTPSTIDLGKFLFLQESISESSAAMQLLNNNLYQQLLAQSSDESLPEEARRYATAAMGALSSFASKAHYDEDGNVIMDLTEKQVESMDLNDFLLIQDFILDLPSFQRLIDPKAAAVFKDMNVADLFVLSGDEDADPFLRDEAQRVLGLASFFAGMATQVVDYDNDGIPDDVIIRLVQDGEMREFALEKDNRVTEMLMEDFMNAFATVLNLEEFKRLLNEGGNFEFEDRNGQKIEVPADAILASTFFGNYGVVTNDVFFNLFGLNNMMVDRDGDGVPEDDPVTRFDLLTVDDEHLQAINSIVVFLAVNRTMLENETGLTMNQIIQEISNNMELFKEYSQTGFDRSPNLEEGDFMFLLYMLREAQARNTTIEEMLIEPRTRAELTIGYQLFDSDQLTQKKSLLWANKQLEILYEIETLQQTLKMVDYFYDIKTAEENIRLTSAYLEELQKLRNETASGKVVNQVEHSRLLTKIDQDIMLTRQALIKYKDNLRDATYAVKRMLKWPEDKPIQFDLGDIELLNVLKQTGISRLATLKLQAAEAKMGQYEAAIMSRHRTNISITGMVDILRAVGVKALGPMYAFNFVFSAGVFDKDRGSLQDASMWAYARTIVEAEELQRNLAADRDMVVVSLDDLDRRIVVYEKTLLEMEERIADVDLMVQQNLSRTSDLVDLYRNRYEVRKLLEKLKRERNRLAAQLAQYDEEYTPVEAPELSTGAKIVDGTGIVLGWVTNPFASLLAPINKAKEKKKLAGIKNEIQSPDLEPVTAQNATVDQLFDMARLRNPLFRQAQAYNKEMELLLKAQKQSILPEISSVFRYFSSVDPGGLQPQKFGDLFTGGRLSYGIRATWKIYDPSRDSKLLIAQKEVEKADLNATGIASQVYLTLVWELETLDRFQTSLEQLELELKNAEERLVNAREYQRFNVFSDPDIARIEYDRARIKDEIQATRSRIETLKIEIKKTVGLTEKDELNFDDDFSVKDIHLRLAKQRFEAYIQEVDGRVDLNGDGKNLIDGMSLTVNDAYQYLSVMRARQYYAAVKDLDGRGGVAGQIKEKVKEMEDLLESQTLTPAEKTAKLNALLGTIQGLAKDIPGIDKDPNTLLLTEISSKMAEFEKILADQTMDPLIKLSKLSEFALYIMATSASLTPNMKWKTKEGVAFETLITTWDKALMGRFDPYVNQRIAIKSAEAYQLQAIVANKMEAIELNLDFLSLFSTGNDPSPGASNISAYFKQNAFNFISIPPKLIEVVFWPVHKVYSAVKIGKIPVLGPILNEIIPGYKSSMARKAAVDEYMTLALTQFTTAKQDWVELQNARQVAIVQYKASIQLRDLMKTRLEEFQTLPLFSSLEEKSEVDTEEAIRLQYLEEYQDALNGLFEAEITLMSLGITPESITVEPVAGGDIVLSVSAGQTLAPKSFEVRMAELNKRIAEARYRKAKASSNLGKFQITTGSQQVGWKFLPFFKFQLFSRESSTPFQVASTKAEVSAADYGISATIVNQASVLQDYYSRLVESRLKAQFYGLMAEGQLGQSQQIASFSLKEVDFLTARVLRDMYRQEAIKAQADMTAEGNILSSLSVTNRNLLLQILPSPTDLSTNLTNMMGIIGSQKFDLNNQPNVKQIDELLRAKQLQQMETTLKYFIPNASLDFQYNGFNKVMEFHLAASWRIIGSGIKATQGMTAADIKILEEQRKQALYNVQSSVAQNQEKLFETITELERIDKELKDLCDPVRMEKLMTDYREGRIQFGHEVTAHLSLISRLMGERAYQLVRLAGLYENLSAVLSANGAPLPPLATLLNVTPAEGDLGNLLTELKNSKVDILTEVEELPSDWVESQYLTPPVVNRVTNITPVPLWTVSKITTVGSQGADIDVPVTHYKYKGETWFKSAVKDMLDEAGIPATDQHLFNVDDWAVLLDEMLKTYRYEANPLTMELLKRILPRVYSDLKDYSDPSDLPNVLSIYIDPVYSRLFPYHKELMFDPEIGYRGDRNLMKKISLSLFYTLELQDKIEQGSITGQPFNEADQNLWLNVRLGNDIKLFDVAAREHRGERVDGIQEKAYLKLLRDRTATWSRFMFRYLSVKEQASYRKVSRAIVEDFFPGLAALVDLNTGIQGGMTLNGENMEISEFGDLQLESLYRSLTAFAASRGMTPQQLVDYMAVVKEVFLPQVEVYLKGAGMRELSQLPDSDRLRFLNRWLNELQTQYADQSLVPAKKLELAQTINQLKSVIEIELQGEKSKMIFSTALFWADQFMRDEGFRDPRIKLSPKEVARLTKDFRDFMVKTMALRELPVTGRLLRMQLEIPSGQKINWLSADAQGFLTAMVMDQMKEKWTKSELLAHLQNVEYAATHLRRNLGEYYDLIGLPTSFEFSKLKDPLDRQKAWGELTGTVRSLEKLNNRVDLSPAELQLTLSDLILFQKTAKEEGLDFEAGLDGYLYRLAHNFLPEIKYQMDPTLPREKQITEIVRNIAHAKNVNEIAGKIVLQELENWIKNPSSRPEYLTAADVSLMQQYIGDNKGLMHIKVDLGKSIANMIQFMSYQSPRRHTREEYTQRVAAELFLQSIYMLHHTGDNGAPLPLQQGDISPYLDYIKVANGRATRDEVAQLFKYDGLIQERMESSIKPKGLGTYMVPQLIEEIEAMREKPLSGQELKSLMSILPQFSPADRIGIASRIVDMKKRHQIGDYPDAKFKTAEDYIDNWMKDGAFIQAVFWNNSNGKYMLPLRVLSAAIDMFREKQPILDKSRKEKLVKRARSIYGYDSSFADLGPEGNNRRLLIFTYYAVFNELMTPEKEIVWMGRWKALKNELIRKNPGISPSEIEVNQQEYVVRIKTLHQVYFDMMSDYIYGRDADPSARETYKKQLEKLEEVFSKKIIEQMATSEAREKRATQVREKRLAENEMLEEFQSIVETRRQQDVVANDALNVTQVKLNLSNKARAAGVTLESSKINFFISKMKELGFNEDEVILRYVILPEQIKKIYEDVTGIDIVTDEQNAIISAFAAPIFEKWGFVDSQLVGRINTRLSSLKGKTPVGTVSEGMEYELRDFRDRLTMSLKIKGLFDQYGLKFSDERLKESEAMRMASDAISGGMELSDIKTCFELYKQMLSTAKELGDVDEDLVLFLTDSVMKLGLMKFAEKSVLSETQQSEVRNAVRLAMGEILNQEPPLSFEEETLRQMNINTKNLSPQILFLIQKHGLEKMVQGKMQNANFEEDVYARITDTLIRRNISLADFNEMMNRVKAERARIEEFRRSVKDKSMFDETRGSLVPPLSDLELLIYLDLTQSDPKKRLNILEVLFGDSLPPEEISRIETKIWKGTGEIFLQYMKAWHKENYLAPKPLLWRFLLGDKMKTTDSTFKNIPLVAFFLAGVTTLLGARRILTDPIKRFVGDRKKWSPQQKFRWNLLLFKFLVGFWTMFLIIWNLSVWLPYPETINWLSALSSLLVTAFLIKVGPWLTTLQTIGDRKPMSVLLGLGGIAGLVTLAAHGLQGMAGLGALVAGSPILAVIVVLHLVLLLMTSRSTSTIVDKEIFHTIDDTKDALGRSCYDINPTMSKTDYIKEKLMFVPDESERETVAKAVFQCVFDAFDQCAKEGRDLSEVDELIRGRIASSDIAADIKSDARFVDAIGTARTYIWDLKPHNILVDSGKIEEGQTVAIISPLYAGLGDTREAYEKYLQSEVLERFALTLRGNNDRSLRMQVIMNGPMLNNDDFRNNVPIKSLGGMNREAYHQMLYENFKPYYDEFSWFEEVVDEQTGKKKLVKHDGSERFEIFFFSGMKKPLPTLYPTRFYAYGEDGSEGRLFGEREYKIQAGEMLPDGSVNPNPPTPEQLEYQRLMQPQKVKYGDLEGWVGLPHLINQYRREGKIKEEEITFVPEDLFKPTFLGTLRNDEESPFASWEEAKKMPVIQSLMPDKAGRPRVHASLTMDNGNYNAPGAGLYELSIVSDKKYADHFAFQGKTGYFLPFKGLGPDTLWHFQGDFIHDKLWFAQVGVSRLLEGLRLFGKYAGTTESMAQLESPKPGFPIGPYHTMYYLYSGYLAQWIESFCKDKPLNQKNINAFFNAIKMTAINGEDEHVTGIPENTNEIWGNEKRGKTRLANRLLAAPWMSKLLTRYPKFELYLTMFLGYLNILDPIHYRSRRILNPLLDQMKQSKEPPLPLRSCALLEMPPTRFNPRGIMIIDDRNKDITAQETKEEGKWLPSNDIPSDWLVAVGRVLGLGARGKFLNNLSRRGLFSEFLFVISLSQGFLYMTFLPGNIEVFLSTASWYLGMVILVLMVHLKVTAPWLVRIKTSGFNLPKYGFVSLASDNRVVDWLIKLAWSPIALLQTLIIDVPHSLSELVTTNIVYLANIVKKTTKIARFYTLDLPYLILFGLNAEAPLNPIEEETVPLQKHFWDARLATLIPVAIGMLLLSRWFDVGFLVLGAIALSVGFLVGPEFKKLKELKSKLQKTKSDAQVSLKQIDEIKVKGKVFFRVLTIAPLLVVALGLFAGSVFPLSSGLIASLSLVSVGAHMTLKILQRRVIRGVVGKLSIADEQAYWKYARAKLLTFRTKIDYFSPLVLLMALAILEGPLSLSSYLSISWFSMASLMMFTFFLRAPVAYLTGIHFKGRWNRFLSNANWFIGAAILLSVIAMHLSGLQPLLTPVLERLTESPSVLASFFVTGDGTSGFYGSLLGTERKIVFIQTVVLSGSLVMGALSAIAIAIAGVSTVFKWAKALRRRPPEEKTEGSTVTPPVTPAPGTKKEEEKKAPETKKTEEKPPVVDTTKIDPVVPPSDKTDKPTDKFVRASGLLVTGLGSLSVGALSVFLVGGAASLLGFSFLTPLAVMLPISLVLSRVVRSPWAKTLSLSLSGIYPVLMAGWFFFMSASMVFGEYYAKVRGSRASPDRLIAPLRDIVDSADSKDILYTDASGTLHGRKDVLSSLIPFRGTFWNRILGLMQWSLYFHENYHQRRLEGQPQRSSFLEEFHAYLAQIFSLPDVLTGRSEGLFLSNLVSSRYDVGSVKQVTLVSRDAQGNTYRVSTDKGLFTVRYAKPVLAAPSVDQKPAPQEPSKPSTRPGRLALSDDWLVDPENPHIRVRDIKRGAVLDVGIGGFADRVDGVDYFGPVTTGDLAKKLKSAGSPLKLYGVDYLIPDAVVQGEEVEFYKNGYVAATENPIGDNIVFNPQKFQGDKKFELAKWLESNKDRPDFMPLPYHAYAKKLGFELIDVLEDGFDISDEKLPRDADGKVPVYAIRTFNALIYYSAEQARQAIEILGRHLVDGGILYDGQANLSPKDPAYNVFVKKRVTSVEGGVVVEKSRLVLSERVLTVYDRHGEFNFSDHNFSYINDPEVSGLLRELHSYGKDAKNKGDYVKTMVAKMREVGFDALVGPADTIRLRYDENEKLLSRKAVSGETVTESILRTADDKPVVQVGNQFVTVSTDKVQTEADRLERRRRYLESLRRAMAAYLPLISRSDELTSAPDAFVLLGNPDLKTFVSFAAQWKERFEGTPIVLAGGQGRGTRPLLTRTLSSYGLSEAVLLSAINSQRRDLQKPELSSLAQVLETDILRFVLIREGIPASVLSDERKPSTRSAENFEFTLDVLAGLKASRVAVVSWPPLLGRLRPTSMNVWSRDPRSRSWKTMYFKSYEIDPSAVSAEELVELAGYTAGYPAEYAEQFGLNAGNELKGIYDQTGLLTRQPAAMSDDEKEKLQAVQSALADYLKETPMVFNPLLNHLEGRQTRSAWSIAPMLGSLKAGLAGVVSALSHSPQYMAGRVVALTNVGAFVAESAGKWFMWPGQNMASLYKTASSLPVDLIRSTMSPSAPLDLSALQETVRRNIWKDILGEGVPVNPGTVGHGQALLVDGIDASLEEDGSLKLDRTVALAFFQQLRAVSELYNNLPEADRKKMPLRVDLLLPQELEMSPAELRSAFESILHTAGQLYPISGELLDRVVFNVHPVTANDQGKVVALVRQRAKESLNTQVVTSRMDFWSAVQSQTPEASLMIVLSRFAVDLARVEVDVVFTGAAAETLRRWIGEEGYKNLPAAVKDGQNLRFKAMQIDPVKDLEDSHEKIRLFSTQA